MYSSFKCTKVHNNKLGFFLILLLFFVDSGKHSPDCDGVNRGSKHAVHNMDILLLIDINFINTNRLGNYCSTSYMTLMII